MDTRYKTQSAAIQRVLRYTSVLTDELQRIYIPLKSVSLTEL